MFGIGMGEFLIILIVGLIVFGPKNLPEVGKTLGKGLREFRKAQAALSATLEEAAAEPEKKSSTETKTAENKITVEKPAEVSLEKKSEPARVTVDDIINTAKGNPISNEAADKKPSSTKELNSNERIQS